MKVLVTGHNGYIGSVMTFYLKHFHTVGGIDTNYFFEYPFEFIPRTVNELDKDIRDISVSDVKGFDAIIHLAALSNDPMGQLNPDLTYDINLFGTLRLAQVAKEAGVKRFLFASSCSVYGSGAMTENGELRPISTYAISKAKAEEGLLKMADKDFSPTILRNGTAYGVSLKHRTDLVLNSMSFDAYSFGSVKVFGDGTLIRPIVHVMDISQAFRLALEAPIEKVHGQIFNVGSNEQNYTVKEIAEIVVGVVPNSVIQKIDMGADNRSYRVEFSKISSVLGFQARCSAADGARSMFDAYRKYGLYKPIHRIKQIQELIDFKLDENLRWFNG